MPAFEIIEDNNDFIIVNKPSAISFHNEENNEGLFNQLKTELKQELWPVHRLDKITSGLIIFAKTQVAASSLGKLFEQKKIDKTYIAISDKKPKKKQGKVIGDMQKSRNGSWKLTLNKKNPAITHFFSSSLIAGKRFFWIKPTTGKTHQIRVALKSVGTAILGDTRYAGSVSDRGYLHAYKLSFEWNTEKLVFRAMPKQGEYFSLPELKKSIQAFENQ